MQIVRGPVCFEINGGIEYLIKFWYEFVLKNKKNKREISVAYCL